MYFILYIQIHFSRNGFQQTLKGGPWHKKKRLRTPALAAQTTTLIMHFLFVSIPQNAHDKLHAQCERTKWPSQHQLSSLILTSARKARGGRGVGNSP